MDELNTLTLDGVTYKITDTAAAPAGYGLGGYAKSITGEDLNTCKKGGAFIFETATNVPGAFKGWCYMSVLPSNGHSATQTVWGMREYVGCAMQRVKYDWDDDAWSAWEWINPPMALGVEYQTIERWQNKAVYTKLVDIGALPNATFKSIDLAAFPTRVLSHEISIMTGANTYSAFDDGTTAYIASYGGRAYFNITTKSDLSASTAIVKFKYVKD